SVLRPLLFYDFFLRASYPDTHLTPCSDHVHFSGYQRPGAPGGSDLYVALGKRSLCNERTHKRFFFESCIMGGCDRSRWIEHCHGSFGILENLRKAEVIGHSIPKSEKTRSPILPCKSSLLTF